jgi:hypothetical protein
MKMIERYSPGAYGGMSRDDNGRYVDLGDVTELLEVELGHDRATAIIHQYFDTPEVCYDRDFEEA